MNKLDGMNPEQRYELLIETALADEALWTLAQNGVPIRFRLQDGGLALPLWPSQETAALEAPDPSEQPQRIALEELMEETLPDLMAQRAVLALYPIRGSGFVLGPEQVLKRLWKEWEEDD
jgi:hypothetical protein